MFKAFNSESWSNHGSVTLRRPTPAWMMYSAAAILLYKLAQAPWDLFKITIRIV